MEKLFWHIGVGYTCVKTMHRVQAFMVLDRPPLPVNITVQRSYSWDHTVPHLVVCQVFNFCASFHIRLNAIFFVDYRGLWVLLILIDLWNAKRGMASLIMHLGERSQIWVGTIVRLRSYYRLGLKKFTGASALSIYLFYFI